MEAEGLSTLNDQQRAAATFAGGPLLIIAGAGTGKTNTLAHRVADHIARGTDPSRILLLTFTRRASSEMLKRVEGFLATSRANLSRLWGGTFHSVANRLLHIHSRSVGLGETFSILDRSDGCTWTAAGEATSGKGGVQAIPGGLYRTPGRSSRGVRFHPLSLYSGRGLGRG